MTFGFAVLSFALAFWQKPGWSTADTKIDLHVDPSRFLSFVASVWTPTTDLGEVHAAQYSGYLWPMGSFFTVMHAIGISPWVAERIWLGLLFSLSAWGMLRRPRVLTSRFGVGLVIHRHEVVDVDVRVALGRPHARVAQHLLDAAQVGALAEQVRREAVAEGVREIAGRPRGLAAAREHAPHDARVEPAAARAHEERAVSAAPAPRGEPRRAVGHVVVERRARLRPERHDAVLAALALAHLDGAAASSARRSTSSTSRLQASETRRPAP